MNNLWQTLLPLAENCWQAYGAEQPIANLTLNCAKTPVASIRTLYQPSLILVLAGAKQSVLGDKIFHYSAGECLLASVDVPVSASILEASPQRPYMAFALALDPILVSELVSEVIQSEENSTSLLALHKAAIPEALIDPLARLLDLTHQSQDIPVIAPLIEREIIWRLLHSPLAAQLKQLGLKESNTARIGRATLWLRNHFDQPLRVADLAELANMSAASFHRHFKTVTQLTPIQYQKQIRLQEAKRLLLQEEEVASIGFAVGYESASRFSRDYRRLFGLAPGQDREKMREQLAQPSG